MERSFSQTRDKLDDFSDARSEMRQAGHNLTSVLMNPRESMYDEIYDEFAYEQSDLINIDDLLASCVLKEEEEMELKRIVSIIKSTFKRYYVLHRDNLAFTIFQHEIIKRSNSNSRKFPMKLQLKRGITNDSVLQCFQHVPEAFFRSDFSLTHQKTFEETLELTSNGHDRLSRYLDLVEMALLRQIWTRSPDFFRALEDIRSLEVQVVKAVIHVRGLRSGLQNADEALAMGAIQIPKLYHRQRNEELLHAKITQMLRFQEDLCLIQTLISGGDYRVALNIILSSKELYQQELASLLCMKASYRKLESFNTFVCNYLTDLFISTAVRRSDVYPNEDLDSLNTAAFSVSGTSEEGFDILQDVLSALLTANQLPSALEQYADRLEDSLKLFLRTCIREYSTPLSIDGDNEGINGVKNSDLSEDKIVGREIKTMSASNFMSCLCMCFEQALSSLQRVDKVLVIIDAAVKAHLKEGSSADGVKLSILSYECLFSGCELAEKLVAHVLSLRTEANLKLSVSEMKLLLDTSLEFLQSLNQLVSPRRTQIRTASSSSSSSPSNALKQALVTQTKGYLLSFHDNAKKNLMSVLDAERWEQCDVPLERQLSVDKLVSGRSFLSSRTKEEEEGKKPSLSPVTALPQVASTDSLNGEEAAKSVALKGSKKKELTPVIIEGTSYRIVYSMLFLLDLLLSYLEMASCFSSSILSTTASDVITRLIEILSLFDTRTKQLVLGAQAIQTSARLKSISAKHLCLTAQSLSLLVILLPHIRAALMAILPPKQHILLAGLDRIISTLLQHQNQVLAKFVDIVCDFVESSSSKLVHTDWDVPKESGVPYFEEIVRNLSALHRVLESHLPTEQVQDVYSRIFSALQRKMLLHFENIKPSSLAGKQRIVDEVGHLVTTLSRLRKIDISGFSVEEAFQKKYLGI